MAERRLKTKVVAPAARDAAAGVALVGTYRARQLAWMAREGVYNWPVKDGDAFDAAALGKVGELWLYADAKGTRHAFAATFAGRMTRAAFLAAHPSYASRVGAPTHTAYYVFKATPLGYGPGLENPVVLVRAGDFGPRTAKVRKAIERFQADGAFAPLEHYLPADLARVPSAQLRVCEPGVQMDFPFMDLFRLVVPPVRPPMPKNPKFTFVDLFAGIGGFRRAAEKNGGTCLGYSEINADAIAAYEANYPESRETNYGDITKIRDLPEHDLLTGGVPCQSWSIAGRNLGFDDDRGQLWNDALYLLNKSRPRAFLFENVKGLADPRNRAALDYILARIRAAGYHAAYHVLNSFDYGVPQSRVRIYIVGFREKRHLDAFRLPPKSAGSVRLYDILDDFATDGDAKRLGSRRRPERTAGAGGHAGATSLSTNNNGFNDYFLLNDIRNGETTIHSWDILKTTPREKRICLLLLKNRRRDTYGPLDGNPLALAHFHALDPSIVQADIDGLCQKGILKPETYRYRVCGGGGSLTDAERKLLAFARGGELVPDALKLEKALRKDRIDVKRTLEALCEKGEVEAVETRYDFRYTKISTGLFGVNRVFLPSSNIFPTLVASDSCDYVTAVPLCARDGEGYRAEFLEKVYRVKRYRRITRQEACRIQGFPTDFILPENRARWMRLIGNSVSVPVIDQLVRAICATGVFDASVGAADRGDTDVVLRERRVAS